MNWWNHMKKKPWKWMGITLLLSALSAFLMTGCGNPATAKQQAAEDANTIRVYLWTKNLLDEYAPYVQSQLPDTNIEFIVGNNNLDYYTFLNENGELPDIITCCRFSLADAQPLKDSLMDLSRTNVGGAVYNAYLASFTNQDGSVNWLPMAADAHGIVVNRGLFVKYGIPLPTDYESFVSACQAFEAQGIRGFDADYMYDYTCMETLQGLSASLLSSAEGRKWRTEYSDPATEAQKGLDTVVWPQAFETMARFIEDTGLRASDLGLGYDQIMEMFSSEQLAMYFGSSVGVRNFRDQGMDTIFQPFFNQNGEQWLMTTPYFNVALSKTLEQDATRREKAIKVLNVMLSQEAQNIVCNRQDTLSYSQEVPLRLTEALKDVRPVVAENHMYIRIASNDFFATSQDVVSKMIRGEYDAQTAYRAFDAQMRAPKSAARDIVLTSDKGYSNFFHADGGNASFSAMAHSLRTCYGSDVLIATANSFTGSVLKAKYTEADVANMVMPNGLRAYQLELTGAELKALVQAFVEGYEGGMTPFNRGSLPVVSGIAIRVTESDGKYTLRDITKDGVPISDTDTFRVSCLALPQHMEALPSEIASGFEAEEETVRQDWVDFVKQGGDVLAEPEQYISLTTK